MDFPPLDFSQVRTYPLRERSNKVSRESLARPPRRGATFAEFYEGLPRVLGGEDLRAVVNATVEAVRRQRPVLVLAGAHVIKCGLSPVLLELMRRGVIAALALNGAGAIHDFEFALVGGTSEDVQRGLDDGTFGMGDETGRLMNQAFVAGVAEGIGAGRALGGAILAGAFPHRELSVLHEGVVRGIPVAIGTDIIHQHPTADGAALGEASYLDFQKLASVVAQLEGGIALNFGSAVVLPEVFLKALTVARNLGHAVDHFSTATFDMIRQYRALENVVRRPTARGGHGWYLVGQHELLIPLWAAAVLEQLS
jgi:hypothetical protein